MDKNTDDEVPVRLPDGTILPGRITSTEKGVEFEVTIPDGDESIPRPDVSGFTFVN